MNPSIERLARDICRHIEDELQRSGIFYRIFVRAKSEDSIKKKLNFKHYENIDNKLMQDVIGIRITLYFNDDLPVVYKALKVRLEFVDETIDETEETVFKPTRTNLIFRLNEENSKEVIDTIITKYKYIDTTYEVQLRTVLSEGWHEVEHDLKYKCKSDWIGNSDIARTFNGVYASLVTSDWSILTIFEKLSYRHFKNQNWAAMLRNKFRLRFRDEKLDEKIVILLNQNLEVAKGIFKIDRTDFLNRLIRDGIRIPLTLSNLIYILNGYYIQNSEINKLVPEFILGNKKIYR